MAKTFKLLLGVLFLTVTVYACINDKGYVPPTKPHNHHLLVLVDKSQSVIGLPAGFSTVLEAQLSPVLNQMIRSKGDNVQGYLIHGATTGNTRLIDNTFNRELPDEDKGGPDDYKDAKDEYRQGLIKFQQRTNNDIISLLEDKSTGEATRETDLLGTLELISSFKAGIPKEDTSMVIFISDMVHSQKEPRDYHIKPIKSKEEAQTCADNDYNWLLTHRKINADAFNNLKIHIIFPSGNYDMSQNDQMMYYWDALLKKVNSTVSITRN